MICTAYITVGKKLRIRWVGHVSCTEEKSIHDFGRKHHGKIPLGRDEILAQLGCYVEQTSSY